MQKEKKPWEIILENVHKVQSEQFQKKCSFEGVNLYQKT